MIPSLPLAGWISLLRFLDSVTWFVLDCAFFARVGMFVLLPYEFRGMLGKRICSRIG